MAREAITTKPKPAPAPDAEPMPASEPRGFGAFIDRQVRRLRGVRPDLSEQGFVAAVRAGIQFVSLKDWNTADDMIEELEHQIRTALHAVDGVWCDYVARDKATGHPRIIVLTSWGLREAVEGQISFKLHYKPERLPANGKR